MNQIISTERVPIKAWLSDIEPGALQQAKNLANLPFTYKHVALMPDCHQGYGMPIGGVLATDGVVIPNAVGVDIGCGMRAMKTNLYEIYPEQLKKIMSLIREYIPVGMNHHKEPQPEEYMPTFNPMWEYGVVQPEYDNARYQLGTLGGGNHFIEIQRDTKDGVIWIMIHSGSRNLGKKVGDYYNKLAKERNAFWYSVVDKNQDLAFLPIQCPEAKAYMHEMLYCVEFAKANRAWMMEMIRDAISKVVPGTHCYNELDVSHNYAAWEYHFGKNVLVHRKGATSAKEDELGIIPGSQGSASYIVKGKGNRESFMSCSHGAGRAMGRNEARKKLNLEDEIRKLDEQGILHAIRNESDLDEAAGAYKDISVVMDNQKDLVDIVVELKPLAVVKG